ncbi:MAG: LptF/LptG family permease [Holosporales bacterium]
MRLNQYLFRQAGLVLLLVTVTLVAIVLLAQSLRLVDLVVNRGAPLQLFLLLMLLLLPGFFLLVLPLALALSVVWLVHRLIADAEWVIFSAAGRSPWQIAKPLLLLATGVCGICYLLSLVILPLSYSSFKNLESALRTDIGAAFIEEGTFNKIGEGITVFTAHRGAQGELLGLMLDDRRNPERPMIILASRARLWIDENRKPLLRIENGSRQELDAATGRVQFLYFSEYILDLSSLISATVNRGAEVQEITVVDLFSQAAKENDPRRRGKLRAAGHSRLISPLLPLAMTAMVLAVLSGAGHNRRGMGRALMIAAGVVVALQAMLLLSESLSAWAWGLAVLQYALVLMPLWWGISFLRRGTWALW